MCFPNIQLRPSLSAGNKLKLGLCLKKKTHLNPRTTVLSLCILLILFSSLSLTERFRNISHIQFLYLISSIFYFLKILLWFLSSFYFIFIFPIFIRLTYWNHLMEPRSQLWFSNLPLSASLLLSDFSPGRSVAASYLTFVYLWAL